MKKVISLLLTALMVLSSFNVVFAEELATITLGDVDATDVADGDFIGIPVTIDKFPEERISDIQLEFSFDKSKLEFVTVMNEDLYGNPTMKVWKVNKLTGSGSLVTAEWTPTPSDTVNANGYGTALFTDTTGTTMSFTATNSLADNKTLVWLFFKKVAGATGTDTVDLKTVVMTGTTKTTAGTAYRKATGEIGVESSTVTFTAGPKDKVETVGTTYTGDLGEVVDGDTTDVATAIYAELNGDTDTTYKKVNWTVNATIDEKAVVGTYTSDVNLSGEATYYLGMVIQGLAQDTVTAVAAALAE